jgi:secondary thiamine-phosphate synthase enzyme
METLTLRTSAHAQLIEITDRIQALVSGAGVQTGTVRIHVPHTTAAVTINENADPTVVHDVLADLERLVPARQPYYQHDEGNSASHMKSSLVGCSLTLLVEQGRLVLGTWQGIFFCEFDGPRTRHVHVRVSA